MIPTRFLSIKKPSHHHHHHQLIQVFRIQEKRKTNNNRISIYHIQITINIFSIHAHGEHGFQNVVVLMLLFTFFPISRDVSRVTDFNCLLSGAIVFIHFAASTNCLERISFFNFSAFNSRCSCAFDLLPIGDSALCCNTCERYKKKCKKIKYLTVVLQMPKLHIRQIFL